MKLWGKNINIFLPLAGMCFALLYLPIDNPNVFDFAPIVSSKIWIVAASISCGACIPFIIEAILDFVYGSKMVALEKIAIVVCLVIPKVVGLLWDGSIVDSSYFSMVLVTRTSIYGIVFATLARTGSNEYSSGTSDFSKTIWFYEIFYVFLVVVTAAKVTLIMLWSELLPIVYMVQLGGVCIFLAFCWYNSKSTGAFDFKAILNVWSYNKLSPQHYTWTVLNVCLGLYIVGHMMYPVVSPEHAKLPELFGASMCYVDTIFVIFIHILPGYSLRNSSTIAEVELNTKRAFVRYISHEMRSPLNILAMDLEHVTANLSEIVRLDTIEPIDSLEQKLSIDKKRNRCVVDMQTCVDEMDHACEHANVVLTDLHLYDAIEGDNVELDKEVHSATSFLEELVVDLLNVHFANLTMTTAAAEQLRVDRGEPLSHHRIIVDGNMDTLDCLVIDVEKVTAVIRALVSKLGSDMKEGHQSRLVISANQTKIVHTIGKHSKYARDKFNLSEYGLMSLDFEVMNMDNLGNKKFETDREELSHTSTNSNSSMYSPTTSKPYMNQVADTSTLKDGLPHRVSSFNPNILHGKGISSVNIWMCKKMAHLHGGNVDIVESKVRSGSKTSRFFHGEGACGTMVHITLPLYRTGVDNDLSAIDRQKPFGGTWWNWLPSLVKSPFQVAHCNSEFELPNSDNWSNNSSAMNGNQNSTVREAMFQVASRAPSPIHGGSPQTTVVRILHNNSSLEHSTDDPVGTPLGSFCLSGTELSGSGYHNSVHGQQLQQSLLHRHLDRSVNLHFDEKYECNDAVEMFDEVAEGESNTPNYRIPPMSPVVVAPLRFLVVDDSAMNRKVVIRLLTSLGYDSCEAWDGAVAVEIVSKAMQADLRKNPTRPIFDGVLLDNIMTHMHGPETAQQLRQLGYAGAILGVTGNTLAKDVKEFIDLGADDVLFKPLKHDLLMSAIQRHVAHSKKSGSQISGSQ